MISSILYKFNNGFITLNIKNITRQGSITSYNLQAEHSMAIRDLTMQIEIANAQKTEFEEASQQLRQEIKDLGIDTK